MTTQRNNRPSRRAARSILTMAVCLISAAAVPALAESSPKSEPAARSAPVATRAASSASTVSGDVARAASGESGSPASVISGQPAHVSSAPAKVVFGFSHKAHLERGAGCSDCHDVTQEKALRMPKMDNCTTCHTVDPTKPGPECAQCHRLAGGKPTPIQWTIGIGLPGVRFNHLRHTVDAKLDCKVCHQGIEQSDRLTRAILPKMEVCIDCHHRRGPKAIACEKCHTPGQKALRPPSHKQGNWLLGHGQQVRRGHFGPLAQQCSFCHQQAFCTNCHNDTPPANHTNEFRLRGHGLIASMDREKCLACHRQDFCIRCHQTTPPSLGPNAHRTGWAFPSNRHCVACHLDRNTCDVCHHGNPGHDQAPGRPRTVPAHLLPPAMVDCRKCHRPGSGLSHPDTGTSCLICHNKLS